MSDLWKIKKGAIENMIIQFTYKYALETSTEILLRFPEGKKWSFSSV